MITHSSVFVGGKYEGKSLTQTTINGTRCVEWVARNPDTLVLSGAFVNLNIAASDASRLAEYYHKNISKSSSRDPQG